jgi:formylglycine-generating enzyme
MATQIARARLPESHSNLIPQGREIVHHPDMVWIPGGMFQMGSDDHHPDEAPAHRVSVTSFWMDVTTVTNEDFARFARATGYMTVAEREPDPQQYPGADPQALVPGAMVFCKPKAAVSLDNFRNWWRYVPGACWRNPEGPGSSIAGRARHPVVQVAYEDALAYASWAGKDLPTEAEWEFAARGGLDGAEFAWGEELSPGGRLLANTWQGAFPFHNLVQEIEHGTTSVRTFPPNSYGLYEMIGNVWEWTLDWYRPGHEKAVAGNRNCVPVDPCGPAVEHSYDRRMPKLRIPRKVLKGGSFLCASSNGCRYRPAARYARVLDTATCHVGFRCVLRNGGFPVSCRMAAAG